MGSRSRVGGRATAIAIAIARAIARAIAITTTIAIAIAILVMGGEWMTTLSSIRGRNILIMIVMYLQISRHQYAFIFHTAS